MLVYAAPVPWEPGALSKLKELRRSGDELTGERRAPTFCLSASKRSARLYEATHPRVDEVVRFQRL